MSAAAFFLSLVPLAVKLVPAEAGIPVSEKLVARGIVAVVVTFVLLKRRGESLVSGKPGLLFLRSALGTIGMVLYFVALENLPLANTVTINKLSPFFVLLFSWMFLKERLKKMQIAAIFTAFAGVALVAGPSGISLSGSVIAALASAVFAGAAYTTLRALRKYDSPLRVVFWFSLLTVAVFLPKTTVDGTIPSGNTIFPLAGIGAAGVMGQVLMTTAYRYAPGAKVAIYGYLSVVFSVAWQIAFFREIPSITVLAGALLVMTGGWLNYRYR
jgi:drug/metabolite transporter (DMT)-like permease